MLTVLTPALFVAFQRVFPKSRVSPLMKSQCSVTLLVLPSSEAYIRKKLFSRLIPSSLTSMTVKLPFIVGATHSCVLSPFHDGSIQPACLTIQFATRSLVTVRATEFGSVRHRFEPRSRPYVC